MEKLTFPVQAWALEPSVHQASPTALKYLMYNMYKGSLTDPHGASLGSSSTHAMYLQYGMAIGPAAAPQVATRPAFAPLMTCGFISVVKINA